MHTYDIGETVVSGDRLAVVTLPSLKGLGEVHCGLCAFAFEVEFGNTTLGYH